MKVLRDYLYIFFVNRQKRISETDYLFGTAWYDAFPATAKLVEPDLTLQQKPSYPRRHLWLKAKADIGKHGSY